MRLNGWVAACLCVAGAANVFADNTGGVFGPAFNDGWKALQYRIGHDPDTHALAQRLHYEQATSSKLMWRGIVATRKTPNANSDFDFVQGELFWQYRPAQPTDGTQWLQGMRFDLRVRDDDRPAQIGVNWMHEFRFDNGLRARALALTAWQFGSNDQSGVFLQTRANLGYRMSDRFTADIELFSSYGSTEDFRDADEQVHQLGPALTTNLGGGWLLFTGALFGLNSASPDTSLRLWLTRSF